MATTTVRLVSRVSLGVLGLLAVAMGGTTMAQQIPHFGDIPFRPASGRMVVVAQASATPSRQDRSQAVALRPAFDRDFALLQPSITQTLTQTLGKGGRINGQTMYNIGITYGRDIEIQASQLTWKFIVHGNKLSAKLTTPSGPFGIGLGSYADPSFAVWFDLTFTFDVALQSSGYKITRTVIEAKGTKPYGKNLSGAVLNIAANVLKLMDGPDVLRALANRLRASSSKGSLPNVQNSLKSLDSFVRNEIFGNKLSTLGSRLANNGAVVDTYYHVTGPIHAPQIK